MSTMIYNGKLIERTQAVVDIEDRGYQFGDGVYEVVRIYNGRPFALTAHIERLYESAKKIYMDIQYNKEDLEQSIWKLLEKEAASLPFCNLYIQVSRGVMARNHVIPEKIEGTLVAYILKGDRDEALMNEGTSAVLVEDTRWLHCDIKSISLLGNVLAKHEAKKAGGYEAILHRNETVTEGSSTNVWIVQDGVVKTHPANNLILNGITRQRILQICEENGIPYSEISFTIEDLLGADEVFISSTTLEIVPITVVDDQKIASGNPGPITKQLQQLFLKEIETECGSVFVK